MVNTDKCEEVGRRAARKSVVLPARLPAQDRESLSRQLYKVHKRIFSGISAEEFHRHVVEPPAEATVIQLYLDDDGRIVGYCAFHRFWRRLGGRNTIILRAEAGLLPEYRGRRVTYGFGMIRAFVEKFWHPFTPVYYLGTLVHPSSYHLFCNYFPKVYPHPDFETPAGIQDHARELINSFPDPPVTKTDPFVRDVGWVTIETTQQKWLKKRGDHHDVEFFKERNPGYPKGHGLVVIVPISMSNLSFALLSRLFERVLIALSLR